MIRRIAIAGIITAALLIPLSATVPAGAGSGPSVGVGCVGDACSLLLSKLIHLTGDTGGGAGFVPLSLSPPPCLWEPVGDAVTGSQSIIRQFPNPDPGLPFGIAASVSQAKRLLRTKPPPPGTWFMLPVNPAAGPAGVTACERLPLFVFVGPGEALPPLPIPARTIAEFAYNHMRIPVPGITTNPVGKGFVNLGTYVWGRWGASVFTGSRTAYEIIATLGGVTVSVRAQVSSFAVNVAGPGTPYSSGCGPTGSRFPRGNPPAGAGPGTPPDCGVLWQAPTTGAAVTATVRWTVTWGRGVLAGPGPNVLPPIVVTGPAHVVPVNEIQSVNGG